MLDKHDVKILRRLAGQGFANGAIPEETLAKASSRPVAYWLKVDAFVCTSSSRYGRWYEMTETAKEEMAR